MANKTPTITEPVVNDVIEFRIRCDGSGNVTAAVARVQPASSDSGVNHNPSITLDITTMTGTEDTAVTNLSTWILAEYKTENSF